MNASNILLDPTAERAPAVRALQPRPATLEGLIVGILDISKARGNIFLDRIAEKLSARGVGVNRYRKPTFTRVAPIALKQQIAAECNVVIEGLAD